MAPLVSPFCFPPLRSMSLERAAPGYPAGKQSRPIVARPYPRRANRRRARRAKMNGSLSPSALPLAPILAFGYTSCSLPSLGLRTPLASSRSSLYPACSVRPTFRTFASRQCSRALHVALYPATFQRLTRYFLSFSRFLHLSFFSFISLSLFLPLFSLSISHLSAFFLSRFYSIFVLLTEIIFLKNWKNFVTDFQKDR